MDGKHLFRQYNRFNQNAFLDYLKQVKKQLGKVIMFTDRARQHQSKRLQECVKENNDSIKLSYLLKGSLD
jgi:hypothetical protein